MSQERIQEPIVEQRETAESVQIVSAEDYRGEEVHGSGTSLTTDRRAILDVSLFHS